MKKALSHYLLLCCLLISSLNLNCSIVQASGKSILPINNEVNLLTHPNRIEMKSVPTVAVKKSIRWAIRHSDDLIRVASQTIGSDAAKVVQKNFAKATPVLNRLLQYDTLVWQTVQDQLTHVVGRQAAIWIRMALEWLI